MNAPRQSARAPFTVPPALRQLRSAWAMALHRHEDLRAIALKCPAITGQMGTDGRAILTGATETGGRVNVMLCGATPGDALHVRWVEADHETWKRLPLDRLIPAATVATDAPDNATKEDAA